MWDYFRINIWIRKNVEKKVDLLSFEILCRFLSWHTTISSNFTYSFSGDSNDLWSIVRFFVSGAIALSLKCAAYNAEIIRAGIQSH